MQANSLSRVPGWWQSKLDDGNNFTHEIQGLGLHQEKKWMVWKSPMFPKKRAPWPIKLVQTWAAKTMTKRVSMETWPINICCWLMMPTKAVNQINLQRPWHQWKCAQHQLANLGFFQMTCCNTCLQVVSFLELPSSIF